MLFLEAVQWVIDVQVLFMFLMWFLFQVGALFVPAVLLGAAAQARIIASHDNLEKEALEKSAKVSKTLTELCLEIFCFRRLVTRCPPIKTLQQRGGEVA